MNHIKIHINNNSKKLRFLSYLITTLLLLLCNARDISASNVVILDESHYSKVFGEIRNYRIFLPPGYDENTEKRYPVIYYYHGWSQRYFGSITDFKADEGESNGGDNIANFVAEHDVIVVKPDGYNRRPDEKYYLRPYNIGPVETYRQFPLYFPELVGYIDGHYRTVPNRENRAITGLSMGGFMAFWISGKYPHLLSAAGNFCGSVEFMVGPKNSPVEYRHSDMYKNYNGVNLRLNYGNEDFIRDYHKDMNKIWAHVMDNYEYKVYDAAHSACGLGEMFGFCLNTFENPPAKPEKWDHIDVYPSFEVWGYHVDSDREIPGFTVLGNVDKNGFRCAVRSFLPDGESMPFVRLSIITPPIYEKEQLYEVWDINPENGKSLPYVLKSDPSGRLEIDIDGGAHEIGINKKEGFPNVALASFAVENMDWASVGKTVNVSIKLLNKGNVRADGVTAKLVATREGAEVFNNEVSYGAIKPGQSKKGNGLFSFRVTSGDVEIGRFRLDVNDGAGNKFNDYVDINFRNGQTEFSDFIVADGKEFDVAAAGDDTANMFLGAGNGDGIANPGESVVILVKDNGRLFRTFLYSSDPCVNPAGLHLRGSDSWTDYDHVGASAKYSIPVLSSECTDGHEVKFFAEYWLPDYPEHIVKRGIVKLKVAGADKTPPQLQWAGILGDNTIQAKVYDGAKISKVKARLSLIDDPGNSFEVELSDDGSFGDRAKGDLVFSNKPEEMGFGLYKIVLTATDIYGNAMERGCPGFMVVH